MRPPGLLVVALALVCSVPAFVGASLGTMTTEDALGRALVLVLGAWGLDLVLRPAALRIIHGPPAAVPDGPRGPEVPAHDGPTVPEVA
jgi:uncharacterized membrane protein YfcA